MPDYSSFSPSKLAALCCWREARGDGSDGMMAVAHQIYNCSRDWRITVPHIILKPNEYSSMTIAADPQFELMPQDDDPQWRYILENVPSVLNGTHSDPTNDAHFYANLDALKEPNWFLDHIVKDTLRHPFTIKVGRHSFFV